jgi:hypothetical protein
MLRFTTDDVVARAADRGAVHSAAACRIRSASPSPVRGASATRLGRDVFAAAPAMLAEFIALDSAAAKPRFAVVVETTYFAQVAARAAVVKHVALLFGAEVGLAARLVGVTARLAEITEEGVENAAVAGFAARDGAAAPMANTAARVAGSEIADRAVDAREAGAAQLADVAARSAIGVFPRCKIAVLAGRARLAWDGTIAARLVRPIADPTARVAVAVLTRPIGQSFPSAVFGWMQVPLPSQTLLVHGSPSSGHLAPASLFVVTQRFVEKSHAACLHWMGAGCLQVGTSFEQLHLPLPRHVRVLHWLSSVHG